MTDITPMLAPPSQRRKKSRRRESWPKKAARHGVCTRTLDRWAAAGVIDPPIYVNGRKYGLADEEPRHDPEEAA
jgi:hypothetical protein